MSNPLEDGLDVVDGIWPEEWGVMEQIWPDSWTVVHDGEVIHESMDLSDHPFLQQLARAYPPPPEEELEPIVEIQIPDDNQPLEPWPQAEWPQPQAAWPHEDGPYNDSDEEQSDDGDWDVDITIHQ